MYHACAEIKVHRSFHGTIYTESFYKEQDIKRRLCKEIEGTLDDRGGLPMKDVANSILSGLKQGNVYLTSDFRTRLLLNNMRGPSPRDSPLLDWMLGFLMSLIGPLIRRGMDRSVYQHKPQ
jgi:3-dehydrosphinganine reductase